MSTASCKSFFMPSRSLVGRHRVGWESRREKIVVTIQLRFGGWNATPFSFLRWLPSLLIHPRCGFHNTLLPASQPAQGVIQDVFPLPTFGRREVKYASNAAGSGEENGYRSSHARAWYINGRAGNIFQRYKCGAPYYPLLIIIIGPYLAL